MRSYCKVGQKSAPIYSTYDIKLTATQKSNIKNAHKIILVHVTYVMLTRQTLQGSLKGYDTDTPILEHFGSCSTKLSCLTPAPILIPVPVLVPMSRPHEYFWRSPCTTTYNMANSMKYEHAPP